MAIRHGKSNLAHVPDHQLPADSLAQFCNRFSVSAVTVDYCVDTSTPQVTFEVTLHGIQIGGGTLDEETPSLTVGGAVAAFKAEVTLTADFTHDQLGYDITLCVPLHGCTDYSGVAFSW